MFLAFIGVCLCVVGSFPRVESRVCVLNSRVENGCWGPRTSSLAQPRRGRPQTTLTDLEWKEGEKLLAWFPFCMRYREFSKRTLFIPHSRGNQYSQQLNYIQYLLNDKKCRNLYLVSFVRRTCFSRGLNRTFSPPTDGFDLCRHM